MNKIIRKCCSDCFGYGWQAIESNGAIYTRICAGCDGQGSRLQSNEESRNMGGGEMNYAEKIQHAAIKYKHDEIDYVDLCATIDELMTQHAEESIKLYLQSREELENKALKELYRQIDDDYSHF